MKDAMTPTGNGAPPSTLPDDPLGAFCRDNHVALRGSGRGPLSGLRFGAKDLFHIAGTRTGFGQPDWLRTHEPPSETAEAVRQLLECGADMVGKTHTDELAYSLSGENIHYGTPVNPCDPQRIPGGSSSGSASAVAGRLVDFALGSDCGGSIRLPASYCGILGIRPTHGRVSLRGAIPFGPSFDVAGWFARDTEIFERVGRALLRGAPDTTPLRRMIVARDTFDLIDPRASEALASAIALCASQLDSREETDLSPEGLPAWFDVFRTLQASEVWQNHGAWVMTTQPRLGPGIKERFAWAARVTPEQTEAASDRRKDVVRRLNQVLSPGSLICLPTSPRIAPLRGTAADKLEIEYRHQAMCLLCVSGLCGLPQISLPLAELDGMPLGLSLIGSRGADEALLGFARRILSHNSFFKS
jgi:amidase